MVRAGIAAMRPKQWTKQVLVLAAPLAAGRFGATGDHLHLLLAVAAFSAAASGTYLFNDIVDREADRLHPVKQHRPIAAGRLSVPAAASIAAACALGAVAAAAAVSVALVAVVVAYGALTLAYSFRLKHIAVVELVVLATGFVLRAAGGAVAADVSISVWFFVCVSAGALLLACGKREAELAHPNSRKVLQEYTASFLASTRTAAVAVALGAYGSWAFASTGTDILAQVSSGPFALAILRYSLIADRGDGGAPEDVVRQDRILLLSGAAWALLLGASVYI
jgi:decaprenyl-phosphate phosphoribosyltransferase